MSRKALENEIEYINGLTVEQASGQERALAERLARLLGEWYERLNYGEKRMFLKDFIER